MRQIALVLALAVGAAAGCQKSEKNKETGDNATAEIPKKTVPTAKPRGVQVPPPDSVGAVPADATKTASGVGYKKLSGADGGDKPGRNDTVVVQYTAWKADGSTQFTTKQRKQPQKMSLANTGPGWTEAMQLMSVGDKYLFWMTPLQAYGPRAAKAPKEILTYEVTLVGIEKAPPVPKNVAAPPADATVTKSGLAYKVITPGTGNEKPRAFDEVELQYTGWTTDGTMIDSSRLRKRARKTLPFREMAGWEEAIQTMVVGEKKRVWIPEPLTKTARWKPRGMLVYDLELVSLNKNQAPPDPPANVAAPPANANKSDKGVSYVVLKKGTGKATPKSGDVVLADYTGWTTDGKMFDSSVLTGKPASIPVGRVIPGLNDVLSTMVAGEKRRAWIPEELAYKGRPGPQGTLVFDIELVEIKEKPKPPPVPKDVAAPPADAKKTPEGIYYKVLEPGTGKEKPKPTSAVVAHYTGWTTDGKMFDSSIPRGQPSTFSLQGVIKGWTIGLQLMVEGQKNRFWIPAELAYKGKPNRPQGMLVFDVELIDIK
jgi:FKBP-type peptidyl-prolyl cis-trans isomerase